jgi:hypothetical protein
LRDLQELIALVGSHDGPIASRKSFCHEWASGRECAEYFDEWRSELAKALSFPPEGLLPGDRLTLAASRSADDYAMEVTRLMWDVGVLLHTKHVDQAVSVLVHVSALDSMDPRVINEVERARRLLAERGQWPSPRKVVAE